MMWWQRLRPPSVAVASTTRARGQWGEEQALAYLQAQGLQLLERNYRTPGRGGGEIDLIMQAADGTVVFVEVRSRSHRGFGGAGSSIGRSKQQRWVYAAQHWLQHTGRESACRFDAVLIDVADLQWFQGVIEVDGC